MALMKTRYVLLWSVVILLTLITAHGWHRSAARMRKAGVALIVPFFLDTVSVPHSAYAASTPLSAGQMLQSDYNEDMAVLKDVLINLKLNYGLIDAEDYKDLRTRMRGGPITNLRKTCKHLCKVLPSEYKQKEFDSAYSAMIEALNDFDTLITKRIQGTGVPSKEAKDEEMTALLDVVVKNYEVMLRAAER